MSSSRSLHGAGSSTSAMGRRQRGQATVEFVIAAMFFLIPLYLIIIALGKFADVQAGASQAARYAAWERTVWLSDTQWKNRMGSTANTKSTDELRSEIAWRVVGSNRTTIAANDKSRSDLRNGTLSMWTDGEGKPLLERYSDLTLAESGHALSLAECPTCVTPLDLKAGPLTLGIAVPQNNMVVADAAIAVGANSAALKRLFPAYTGYAGLQTSDRVALLPNEWMANGRNGVTTVVQDAVPTSKAPLKTALELAVKPMAPFAMEIIPLKVGDIRPDEIPADRLQ